MTSDTPFEILRPVWMRTASALRSAGANVRSCCRRCGTELRVDIDDLVARYGPGYSLIDASERCRMIGCDGATYYRAAKGYGRTWIDLVDRRPDASMTEAISGEQGRG